MPLREQAFDLDAEADRIHDRLADIAAEAADLDDDDPEKRALLKEGQQLDTQLQGVRWAQTAHEDEAVPAWGDNVDTVTLAGLTGGEWGKIEDDLTGTDAAGGATRVQMVAAGTIDAPYVRDGESATIAAVASLPLSYLKWAESQINDLSGARDEGNASGFSDLLRDARNRQTSTED